jgi:hypothetical protein
MLLVALALVAVAAMAQDEQAAPGAPPDQKFSTNLTQSEEAPSYSDLYCSGFLSKQSISKANLIAAGTYSPEETQYARGSTIFVNGGGMQEGMQYSVLRELHDPNRWEPFDGARKAVEETGQPYAELGRIRVVALRGGTAVAEVEFSCQNMTIGDIVVPFKEHAPVSYRKVSTFQRFPADSGHLTARIVMAREFDAEVGRGQKVYINAGTNKGVKVGDYFRAVRGYDPKKLNYIHTISNKAPIGEDTQKVEGKLKPETAEKLPVRALGEMVVINVTDSSATAMITSSLEDIEVGDWVQLEDEGQ